MALSRFPTSDIPSSSSPGLDRMEETPYVKGDIEMTVATTANGQTAYMGSSVDDTNKDVRSV